MLHMHLRSLVWRQGPCAAAKLAPGGDLYQRAELPHHPDVDGAWRRPGECPRGGSSGGGVCRDPVDHQDDASGGGGGWCG